MRLGPLDVRILRLLHEDARRSFRELAETLGSTTPTVSARVKAMEDIGLVRGYHAQLDPAILGGAAYVLSFTVAPQQAAAAHAAVLLLPGVTKAFLLAGGRIVAHADLHGPRSALAQLHERIAEVPGLQAYDAAEVLHAREAEGAFDLPEEVDVPCHECKGPIHGEPVKGRFAERMHVFCCRNCLSGFRERFEARAAAARKPTRARGPAR